jgi:putative transposase
MTGRKLAPICRVLGIGRATVYRAERVRGPRYRKAEDRVVRAHIREVIRTRATYGARRVHALVNRSVGARYNLKRIRRVMALEGWTLPRRARRRTGRAHTGQVQRAVSNERWCSDGLEIACWNGEYVQIGFVLDCHDRECLAWVAVPRDLCAADIQQLMHQAVAHRFGAGHQPAVPIQWLSDNGSIYTALDSLATAERLNFEPITTPAPPPVASPESNGMAEAFVNTLKRDYVSGADRGSAAALLEQVSAWIADYNAVAPHSALGFRSPMQYRSEVLDVVPAGP